MRAFRPRVTDDRPATLFDGAVAPRWRVEQMIGMDAESDRAEGVYPGLAAWAQERIEAMLPENFRPPSSDDDPEWWEALMQPEIPTPASTRRPTHRSEPLRRYGSWRG